VLGQDPMTYCEVFVHDLATCCYHHPAGEIEWACWGAVSMATWNDPQQDAAMSACGYPIYPFQIDTVMIALNTPDSCTFKYTMAIYDYIWDHCSPYPGEMLWESNAMHFVHGGGWTSPYIGARIDPPLCVYDRFFAVFNLWNSNDFYDPSYCPDAPYQFWPSALFDLSGWCERSYWNPYGPGGHWYDAVCELPAYGRGWPGVVQVRTRGFTAEDNQCADSVFMWQKEAFYEEDTLGNVIKYAPSGVPDFDQKQKEREHPEIDAPWDGPTALANCLWWMAAACMFDPFWNDSDGDGDNWDPDEVPNLINMLAGYMNFGDCGVTPTQMDSGLAALKEDLASWFTHEEVYMPTWEQIEYNIRISQNVLLLLGFWWQDTSGAWFRIGGHWVTCAGVDYIHGLLKISDPDLDMNCSGQGIYYVPHLPHPLANDTLHNDAGNVSHDIYPVMESITPCGVLMFAPDTYPWWDLDLDKYLGHNLNPQCQYPIPEGVPPPPIWVEIEAAKIICPEVPFKCETIWAYRGGDIWTGMTKCNYGREGARDDYAFYWDDYGNALLDGSIILGNAPSNLAFFGGDNDPPGEFWPYLPMTRDFYYVEKFTNCNTGQYEDLGVNVLTTKYYHNNGLPLDIEHTAIAFDETISCYCSGEVVLQDFKITNTGDASIENLYFSIWLDWDLDPDLYADHGGFEEPYYAYQYNTFDTTYKFGIARVPSDTTEFEKYASRFVGIDNIVYIHPNGGWGWDRDSLWNLLSGPDWAGWNLMNPHDYSTMMSFGPFSLGPGQSRTEAYIHFGYKEGGLKSSACCNAFNIKRLIYFILKIKGFCRGDVNCDGSLDLSDVIYTALYYFGKGPPPMPFLDQGDVNCDGVVNLADVIYLANYKFGKGPSPIDKPRFPQWDPLPRPGTDNWGPCGICTHFGDP